MLRMQRFRLVNGEHFHYPIFSSGLLPLSLGSPLCTLCCSCATPTRCAAGIVSAGCLCSVVNTGEEGIQLHHLSDHAEPA